ncbi:30S ribosomal protein S19 [Patescibacteria group bacterium]|nr:30S ribosomal protein S19 [Patescibacteria group bacterium]
MSRSLKKGWYVDPKLQIKVSKAKATNDHRAIKTWSRSSTITPEMVELNFEVHNGKKHILVFVSENMVGHKLGEFSPTRKFVSHGGRMAKEQAKKPTSK